MDIRIEVEKILEKNGPKLVSKILMAKNNAELLQRVLAETEFLGQTEKLTENVFALITRMTEKPICRHCRTVPVKFKGMDKGYADFCSVKCSRLDESTQAKQAETSMKKYGVAHPSQAKEVREKVVATSFERFGARSNLCTKESQEKMKATNLKKYGTEYAGGSTIVMEKVKVTNKLRYGTEYSFQAEEVKEKFRKSTFDHYGVEYATQSKEVQDKTVRTNLERYGTKRPSQNAEVRKRIQETSLKNYGTSHPMKSDSVKTKTFNTNIEKYGHRSSLSNEDVREKIRLTNIERYGYDNPSQNPTVAESIRTTFSEGISEGSYDRTINALSKYNELGKRHGIGVEYSDGKYFIRCSKCGNVTNERAEFIYARLVQLDDTPCTECLPRNSSQSSKIERFFGEFLTAIYDGEIRFNDRSLITPLEIDAYLPEINLAVEINGTFWHSENFKGKDYHFGKTDSCMKKGVRLVQLFEDEFEKGARYVFGLLSDAGKLKKNLDYGKLREVFGVNLHKPFAVKLSELIVKRVSADVSSAFLKEYSFSERSYEDSYGAFDRHGNLICLATFASKPSDGKRSYVEMVDFAKVPGVTVNCDVRGVGNVKGELLAKFIGESPDTDGLNAPDVKLTILASEDLRTGDPYGKDLEELGFEAFEISEPEKIHFSNGKRTEGNGNHPVYDCGRIFFRIEIK